MRQLLNWRFVAAVAALAVLALIANAVFADDEAIESVIAPEQLERRIDLMAPVVSATSSEEFGISTDGTTTGFLDLALGGDRVMGIVPGTYGEIDCDDLGEPGRCAVFADLLGDAVVWFSVLPLAPRATAELPPIVELQDGDAVFVNGWRLPYAPVIERECGGEDIPTFSDFLRSHAEDSVSIVDLEAGEVVSVRCADVG